MTTSWYAGNCLYVSKSGRLLDVLDCDIAEIDAEGFKSPLSCSQCAGSYRMPAQEIVLRKDLRAPLPVNCPRCRRLRRSKLMNPTKLFERTCDKCGSLTISRYPAEYHTVYCQSCFNELVLYGLVVWDRRPPGRLIQE